MTTLDARAETRELGPIPRFLYPAVNAVARVRATVHTKLLAGFLAIALLMLSMAVLSITVLARVDGQVDTLTALNRQTDQARQMIYDVTAQSHYRAMALLTNDASWNDKIYAAKDDFAANLESVRSYAVAHRPTVFTDLAATDARFRESSDEVTKLYDEGRFDQALNLHIEAEHTISHMLEDPLKVLIADSQALVRQQTTAFHSSRTFLTVAVATFAGVSLLAALALGAVLSWSLIRPVRRVDGALERIAAGDFDARVEVPNRDEFGNLTTNLNRTSERLATLYRLEHERTARLKRYVSPQIAERVLEGERGAAMHPSRKFLTVFFSDIRGFTEAAEQMEPEELVEEINDYLAEMTEIVFKHGGTLDKYVGDAVMVFFGDPVPQEDHARRAVLMGLEMRSRLVELQERWLHRYNEVFKIGMGISTGWVTVGDIGPTARSDYTVIGNQVNLAARLADRAQAGQILVTERTMLEVEGLVDGRPVDEVTLKGVSRPVKIFEIQPSAGAS